MKILGIFFCVLGLILYFLGAVDLFIKTKRKIIRKIVDIFLIILGIILMLLYGYFTLEGGFILWVV